MGGRSARRLLALSGLLRILLILTLACVGGRGLPGSVINDVSQMNPIPVERIVRPRSIAQVQELVAGHPGPISIAGARHSMGGQIATRGALTLDMRALDHVVAFSPEQRWITVEAGSSWREIQNTIDPENLSLRIMQSYANFTVGGSLSVNAHGRYVNEGPLIRSVRSIQVVRASGELVEASPTVNPAIFYGAIGGYGGLGVIVTATLDLVPNEPLETQVRELPLSEYAAYFEREVRGSPSAVMHNADFYPPRYDKAIAITYARTDRPVTLSDRLQPEHASYFTERIAMFWLSELPFGRPLREHLADRLRLHPGRVVWRNYEASYDVADVEPWSRSHTSYVLQEYFVPVRAFDAFVPKLVEILQRYDVNAINVSIRHAGKDPGSLLAWAREECFAFVLFYKQRVDPEARTEVGLWTRELIEATLSVGGTYYLPYQLHASEDQFRRAYPRAGEFFALKAKLDPTNKFRNKLWDKYFKAPAAADREQEDAALGESLRNRPGYLRPGSQTFLTRYRSNVAL
jgi:FAD/FMN-containing dehydrogenase